MTGRSATGPPEDPFNWGKCNLREGVNLRKNNAHRYGLLQGFTLLTGPIGGNAVYPDLSRVAALIHVGEYGQWREECFIALTKKG